MIKELYDENCVLHALLVCDMPAKFIPFSLDDYSQYLYASSGASFSKEDFLKIGERIETLIRMFNSKRDSKKR
jgi:aldehyde:ferredoxin oxidoreductase